MRPGRATFTVVAATGAVSLIAAAVLAIAYDFDAGSVGWVFGGPAPFYAAGLFAYLRRPDHPAARWLLSLGSAYSVSTLAEYGFRTAVNHDAPGLWALNLGYLWAGQFTVIAGIGFIGLFPVGRPEHAHERWILRVFGVTTVLLPVLLALSRPALTVDRYTFPDFPTVDSPLYVPLLSLLGPIAKAIYDGLTILSVIVMVAMLVYRYRHAREEERRQIQWLMLGTAFGIAGLVAWMLPPFAASPQGSLLTATYVTLLILGTAGTIACILIGLLRAGCSTSAGSCSSRWCTGRSGW